jgi:hypothetical protein
MRKLVGTLLAVAIAVVGVIGLIAFFNGRDESTTGGDGTQPAPGTERTAAGGSLLEQGNVVLRYSDRSLTAALETLASDLGAPDSPELRAAGQAVVLRRDPQAGGVVAEAFEHTLTVATPSDPQLQAFIERWLGQAASG